MGVRVLIKKNDITYIGIDVFPDISPSNIHAYNGFIHIFGDVIIAKNNQSKVLNLLDAHPEWFIQLVNRPLTKRDVIYQIANRLYKEAVRLCLLDDASAEMECGFFVITQATCFQVLKNFAVVEITQFASFSHEEMMMFAYQEDIKSQREPKDIIHDILKSMYHHLEYIHPRFVVFNNNDMRYEFLGGKPS